MTLARRLLALGAWVFALAAAAAPLTEAEKQLLLGQMSASMAQEFGKQADAAALERIIAIGDPALVQSFGYGMQLARINALPPPVEQLVVLHFNDPRSGPALRAFVPRYQTRTLFDLHYARVQATYKSDEPSLQQILNTDLAGIDEMLMRVANKFPATPGQPSAALGFAARRKYFGAVPLLIANLENGYAGPNRAAHYNTTMDLLLAYPSIEVWKQASDEIERLKREGRIADDAYAAARARLDPVLEKPEVPLARMRSDENWNLFMARRDALQPNGAVIFPLMKSDPSMYVDEQARFLERQEAIAADLRDERVNYTIASDYGRLGAFTRFGLEDARRSLAFLEKGAKGRDLLSQVLLADTYQLALNDKAKAIRAYRDALATASEAGQSITPYATPGSPMNEFWKAWMSNEIAFLTSGERFRGSVPEQVVGGFWESMWVWSLMAAEYFRPWALATDHPGPRGMMMGAAGARFPLTSQSPPAPQAPTIDRKELAARLGKAPASRFALILTMRHISALPDSDAILREFARSDPSGYWTTIALGSVAYHDGRGAEGRQEALANGVAQMLPGMMDAGAPNPLSAAARLHLQSRNLRIVKRP